MFECPSGTFGSLCTNCSSCPGKCLEGILGGCCTGATYVDEENMYCPPCTVGFGCKTCTNGTACVTCAPDTPLYLNGICYASCPSGYISNDAGDACVLLVVYFDALNITTNIAVAEAVITKRRCFVYTDIYGANAGFAAHTTSTEEVCCVRQGMVTAATPSACQMNRCFSVPLDMTTYVEGTVDNSIGDPCFFSCYNGTNDYTQQYLSVQPQVYSGTQLSGVNNYNTSSTISNIKDAFIDAGVQWAGGYVILSTTGESYACSERGVYTTSIGCQLEQNCVLTKINSYFFDENSTVCYSNCYTRGY